MINIERTQPAIRVTAMPADANAYGDIFGGWLTSLMDMGAGRSLLSYFSRFMRRARYDIPRFSRAAPSFERVCRPSFFFSCTVVQAVHASLCESGDDAWLTNTM